jgi:dethiobiotin synthetase
MSRIIVSGIGTGVGKTIASAVLTKLLHGDYWKPVECGMDRDSEIMHRLIDSNLHIIHPSAYCLKAPLSPHHAARLENVILNPSEISIPHTERPLIIEMAGGILTPLTQNILNIDAFQMWKGDWILVSQHYLGSINHTLLTIEALKKRSISLLGIIFNGIPDQDSEEVILQISKLSFLGRLLPMKTLTQTTIQGIAHQWKNNWLNPY